MAFDANLWWGQDLILTASGDIAVVTGLDRDNQRIFRRLCTNGSQSGAKIGEYCFHPTYGGSAPWYVGQTSEALLLEGVIRSQMYMETAVSHSPEPDIEINFRPTGAYVAQIKYINAATDEAVPPLEMTVTQ
jgi:hypothetical protein